VDSASLLTGSNEKLLRVFDLNRPDAGMDAEMDLYIKPKDKISTAGCLKHKIVGYLLPNYNL